MDSKDSQQLIYETFSQMMVDSFYEFLLKVEKSEMVVIDCPFMKKLKDIDKILQKIFVERNPSTPNLPPAKKISTRNEPIPPKIKNSNQKMSTYDDKKRKKIDSGNSTDFFERMKIYISRDVEGSDDSDSEIESVPVNSENLFKTDYPEECFMTEDKKENEVNCPDVSSSLNTSKPLITSVDDDPYIRQISPEKPEDPNDQKYPYIVKVIEDVYKCELCLINNLPKNNVSTHVNGRQHKNALHKRDGSEVRHKEAVESSKVIPPLPLIPMFECTLCKTEITCRENALQHVNGKQHNKKLENARVNI